MMESDKNSVNIAEKWEIYLEKKVSKSELLEV